MAFNKKLALKRIDELFAQAEQEEKYANRYVELARKIAMKAQVSIPREYRRRYCHSCYSYILPGKTGRSRIYKKTQIITCFNCGNVDRYPLK